MDFLEKEYDVYFIQNCCQKGIKMDYTKAEFDELYENEKDNEEEHDKFLDEVFIQVIDHKNDGQPIYQGKDVNKPIVSFEIYQNQIKEKKAQKEERKYLKTYRSYNEESKIHTFYILFRTHYLIT